MFTRLENPIPDTKTLDIHMKFSIFVFFFFSFATFSIKLFPRDIDVVNIDDNNIIAYIIFKYGYMFEITYATGISRFSMFTSTFISIVNIIIESIIVIIVTIIDIFDMSFFSVK